MPKCEQIRGIWGCGGDDWAGVVVCAASAGMRLSQVHIWFSIAGSMCQREVGTGEVGVSWMIGLCGGTSMRREVGRYVVTRWRISLPVWMLNCVVSGEVGLPHWVISASWGWFVSKSFLFFCLFP